MLVLVPTEGEAEVLSDLDLRVEICGTGLAQSGVSATRMIGELRPEEVVLFGIAGTYDPEIAQIGSAAFGSSVTCFGIGVGCCSNYISGTELDWYGENELPLIDPSSEGVPILSTASASFSVDDARARAEHHPGVVAEEMEGFAVALACKEFDLPLTIVRGISNLAGDRDKSGWKIVDALHSARDLLVEKVLP